MHSRRQFLDIVRSLPLALIPAPLWEIFTQLTATKRTPTSAPPRYADSRLTPHYPAASPLDSIFDKVETGRDEFVTEKYAEEIEEAFEEWRKALRQNPPGVAALGRLLLPSFRAASFRTLKSISVRPSGTLQVFRNQFSTDLLVGLDTFLAEVSQSLDRLAQFLVTEFEVTSLKVTNTSPITLHSLVR